MKTTIISERNLIYCISGQLYAQAPNRKPRNGENIIRKVVEIFREKAENENEFYYISVELKPEIINEYIRSLLMQIEDFKNLNLSQIEFENNISVDDPNRSQFSFSSAYDKHDSNSWKYDFIDLDAFIRNVCSCLIEMVEKNDSCEAESIKPKTYYKKNSLCSMDIPTIEMFRFYRNMIYESITNSTEINLSKILEAILYIIDYISLPMVEEEKKIDGNVSIGKSEKDTDKIETPIFEFNKFKKEVNKLINRYSIENTCNTPDFILSEFICSSLKCFIDSVRKKDKWFDFDPWKDKNGLNSKENGKENLKL